MTLSNVALGCRFYFLDTFSFGLFFQKTKKEIMEELWKKYHFLNKKGATTV